MITQDASDQRKHRFQTRRPRSGLQAPHATPQQRREANSGNAHPQSGLPRRSNWPDSRADSFELDAFLRRYFDEFAFKTMTTEKFFDLLRTRLLVPNNISEAAMPRP